MLGVMGTHRMPVTLLDRPAFLRHPLDDAVDASLFAGLERLDVVAIG